MSMLVASDAQNVGETFRTSMPGGAPDVSTPKAPDLTLGDEVARPVGYSGRRGLQRFVPGRPALLGALGTALFLGTWEWAGRAEALGPTWPALSTVVSTLTSPERRPALLRALSATCSAAGRGFLIGSVVGVLLALIGTTVPLLRPGIERFSGVVHALPLIALAPLFIVTVGREGTPIAIATLAVFFTMFVSSTSAFRSATTSAHDLFTVGAASRRDRFLHLELPAAMPGIFEGLRMAAPAAVLGAVLGEWFGAPRGIGLLIVSAMQNYQIGLLWAAAFLSALISMVSFGLLSLAANAGVHRFAETE